MEYKWTVLSNTTLGILMSSIDMNIVLIALPTIAVQLPGMTALDTLWILLGYQLVIACVLVNFGRLSDLFGRVKLYNIGFALFTVGSALCSLSSTPEQLIGFRIVQAIGAGFLYSNSAAIVTDAFPPGERGRALGINQISIVAGSVIGLVVGGFLTTLAGWRSIFWVNIPIGIFATYWAHTKLHEITPPESGRKSIDLIGNVAFASALFLALIGITLYAINGLNIIYTIALFVTALLLFVAFFIHEGRIKDPMFDLSLFKNKIFTVGNETIFLNSLSRGSFILVMVFYLQGPLMHFTPLNAGIFLIPMSLSLSITGPISGSLSDRYGQKLFVLIGLTLTAIGFLYMTTVSGYLSFVQLVVPLSLIGAGMGIFASPNRASIMSSAPAERRGLASGISTTLMNVGQTLSIGLAFLLMDTAIPRNALDSIFAGTSSGLISGGVQAFVNSVHVVFIASFAMLVLSIFLYLVFTRSAKWNQY